ncbi:ABC transporter permease [Sphingomicrobium flavum]|uniref:ABC transporter permease n=1 Tax=Sphingomicrobium flavum TaxID=1229164 RepID=UPI0021AD7F94|nr:ABC transporter permease [Sphingomicrobium flavum]
MNLDPKAILLVAKREFRQILAMKSFWVSLLLLPAALALAPLVTNFLDEDEATRIALIDRADSSAGAAIRDRIAMESDLDELRSLSRYVRKHELEAAAPDAPWSQHDRVYGPADVMAFRQAGGLDGALEQIDGVRGDDIPDYDPAPLDFELVDGPTMLATASAEDIEAQREALFDEEANAEAPDIVMLIEEDYADRPMIRLWSNEQPSVYFLNLVNEVTTADLRTSLLERQGVDAATVAAIDQSAPALQISTPKPGGGARDIYFVRSLLPLAAAYILMMSLTLSGSWLVQGSVEERGNKLLESVIACIRPEELMYGKLIGTMAVGLSMVVVWVLCGVFAAVATQGAIAQFIQPALEPLSDPSAIIAIIWFFLLGYVALSVIFLAVGAMSDSMNEAQGFLMPVLLIILMPVMFLMQAVMSGGKSLMIDIMTWIPILTPFAVLARLGVGIENWELIGAGLLLLAFVVLELWLLGKLFRASLLSQGQKGGLKALVARFKPAA